MENCSNCKKKKQFANCCNFKKVNHVQQYQDSSESNENSKTFGNEALFIIVLGTENFLPFDNGDNKLTANLEVNNTFVSFKIDTGIQANILPFLLFFNLQNCPN